MQQRQHVTSTDLPCRHRSVAFLLGIFLAGTTGGCSNPMVHLAATLQGSSPGATKSAAGRAASDCQSTNSTSTGSAGVRTGSGSSSAKYKLPSERNFPWNPGLMSKGGIPSSKSPICNSTPLVPTGTADDSAQINATIGRCRAGSIVQLGAGTFLMGKGQYIAISKSVVLRGAGAGSTILKNPLNVFATPTLQQAADTTPLVIVGPGRWVNPDGEARCQGLTAYQPARPGPVFCGHTKRGSLILESSAHRDC